MRLGAAGDRMHHAGEDELMDGIESVPVSETGQAVRFEVSRLHEERPASATRRQA